MWPSAPVSPLAGLRLLLADDADSLRQLYADALRKAGAEIAEANDGAAAVALWHEAEQSDAPFDGLVLDFEMPELDGAAVASRLRAAGYSGVIVGVSGEVSAEAEDRWIAAGCDKVVCKGMPLHELVGIVAAACGRWAG